MLALTLYAIGAASHIALNTRDALRIADERGAPPWSGVVAVTSYAVLWPVADAVVMFAGAVAFARRRWCR